MTSTDEKAEIDELIAQLSSSQEKEKTSSSAASSAERKRVYIRQNSGSSANNQHAGSPTDAHKHLLQKNTKIYKKNDRKSRQGKGRGLAKKGGAGGNYTWGSLGSEFLDEYDEDEDDDDYEYNQAKERHLAAKSAAAAQEQVNDLKVIENLDKDIKPLIDEYFVNGDGNDVAQSLGKYDLRKHGDGELLAYIITVALEKSNVHKELVSRLLHDLNGVIFRSADFIRGFDILLTTLNDLSLDNPDCTSDIGKFLARSIADKCVDNQQGKYFARYKGSVKCPKMQAALDKAEILATMGDFYFLNNIWGAQSSGFRPVRELADKMNFIIHEYYDSGDSDETIRSLKELNVPHFLHEFVYELMEFSLEKNTERAQQLTIALLEKLTQTTVITYDQLKTGILRLFEDIDDIQLDVPNVDEQLQNLFHQLEQKKIVNQDILSNIPAKGRKRLTSGDK